MQDCILHKQNAKLPGSAPGNGTPNNSLLNCEHRPRLSAQRDHPTSLRIRIGLDLLFPALEFTVVPSPYCRLPLPLSHGMLEMPLSCIQPAGASSNTCAHVMMSVCVCVYVFDCAGTSVHLCVRWSCCIETSTASKAAVLQRVPNVRIQPRAKILLVTRLSPHVAFRHDHALPHSARQATDQHCAMPIVTATQLRKCSVRSATLPAVGNLIAATSQVFSTSVRLPARGLRVSNMWRASRLANMASRSNCPAQQQLAPLPLEVKLTSLHLKRS